MIQGQSFLCDFCHIFAKKWRFYSFCFIEFIDDIFGNNVGRCTANNVVGAVSLDELLVERDKISEEICNIIDEATDPWGIKINRVELKNILPPRDIQEAMEKQMRAEREKREAILRAEGDKQSQILTAQGEKESTILRAEAKKVAMIKEAEGRAEALLKQYEAEAQSIRLINDAKASNEYLTLKAFESYTKLADGKSTKLVVPSDLGNLVSTVATIAETAKKTDTQDK